ncbi:MAG: fibronectin type III domain-containing protein, partial [Bacteroidia bacterium]|nr:fibronectin type III domain-containing protein [Bacteroidia bacterium]
ASIAFDLNPQGFSNPPAPSYSAFLDGSTAGQCHSTAYGDGEINSVSASGHVLAVLAGACGAPIELTIDEPAPVCAGPGTVQIVLNHTAVSYAWTGPNGFSSTDQSPLVPRNAANSGVYSVVATDAFGCLAVGSVNVTINPLPTTPGGFVSPLFSCATSETLAPTFPNDGNHQLRWYVSMSAPSPFSTANSLTITAPVTYYVSVANTVTGCESARVEAEVNVAPKPQTVGVENITASQARPRWRKAPLWVSSPGFPYGKFQVQYIRVNPNPENSWTTATSNLADTTLLLTGLSAQTTYQFRVRYECLGGWSAWSDTNVATRFTTLAATCNTPATPTTSFNSSTSRNLSWGPTGSAISYAVANGNVLNPPASWPVHIVSAPNTTYTWTGLSSSINYRCRVLANCTSPYSNTAPTAGSSAWSATSATYKTTNPRLAQNSSSGFDVDVYPNPNAGAFTVAVACEEPGVVGVEVLDVMG